MKNKSTIETELKFRVDDVIKLFKKLQGVKPKIYYIKDEIFNCGNERLRKRTIVVNCLATIEYQLTKDITRNGVKRIIEKNIKRIPKGFVIKNSYEKIRYLFERDNCLISIDFYPIGIFCEIEGKEKDIKRMAKRLGFRLKDSLSQNIDAIYCSMTKKARSHWGFGKI